MKNIEPEELHKKLHDGDKNEILVDVRTKPEFESERIDGAENIPLSELTDSIEKIDKFANVYVTCGTGMRSKQACQLLEERGLKHVINVDGGVKAWQTAGLKTIHTKGARKHIPIIRQTLLTAGLLVLAGTILAIFLDSYWLAIPLFVGAGLTFAGFTGICFMSKLLEKMPWNR